MLEEMLRYKRFDIDIKIQQDNRKATTQEEVEELPKAIDEKQAELQNQKNLKGPKR